MYSVQRQPKHIMDKASLEASLSCVYCLVRLSVQPCWSSNHADSRLCSRYRPGDCPCPVPSLGPVYVTAFVTAFLKQFVLDQLTCLVSNRRRSGLDGSHYLRFWLSLPEDQVRNTYHNQRVAPFPEGHR